MRYFWIILGMVAIIALYVLVFFQNIPRLTYNALHRTKKKVKWDPMDFTEDFYHK